MINSETKIQDVLFALSQPQPGVTELESSRLARLETHKAISQFWGMFPACTTLLELQTKVVDTVQLKSQLEAIGAIKPEEAF